MTESQSVFTLLKRLWVYIPTRRRVQLAALAILTLLSTIAELVSLGLVLPFLGILTAPEKVFSHPWLQPVISVLDLSAPERLLLPLTIMFTSAAIMSGAIRLALLWGQTRIGNAIGNDLGSDAYRRTLYQPYSVHVARNSSRIVAALMTKINTVVYFIVIPVLTIITSTFIVFGIIIFTLFVDLELTLMSILSFGFIYAVVFFASKNRLSHNGQWVNVSQSRLAQVVQEGLGGIRDVLIDGLQETYSLMYRQTDGKLRRALSNITIIGGAPRPVIEAFGIVLIGILAYLLSIRSEGMSSAIPVLGALALAAQRLLPLVQQSYAGWTSIQGGKDSLRDVLELLAQPLPTLSNNLSTTSLPFVERIRLNNVHFRYSTNEPWILRGIDLDIPRGNRIGFIGSTGCGKSTLLDIIMGLLIPSVGSVCIDFANVDDNNQRAWQVHIAHVPQTIFLSDSTIAENIALGVPHEDISIDRVKEAAERAKISDEIETWVDGYDTLVGERGMRLSGGQCQRIGIARALYKQADVIVLDEATSALDNDTECAVMNSINALGSDLTLLIVAHRVTTLQQCDSIVELSEGSIRKVGTYQEMISQLS